jgi:hypothetical protein
MPQYLVSTYIPDDFDPSKISWPRRLDIQAGMPSPVR